MLSRPIVITSLCHYYYYYSHLARRPQCTHKRGGMYSFAVEYLATYRGRSNDRDRPYVCCKRKKVREKGGKNRGGKYRGVNAYTREYIARKRSESGINPTGWPEDKRERGGWKHGGVMMMVGVVGGGHVHVTRESCVEARDRFLAIP